MRLIPKPILKRVAYADFLIGVDPVFVGLHYFRDTSDGRSYAQTAHVAYPFHQPSPKRCRTTTVVLPHWEEPCVIVHELGHVLDEHLGFEYAPKPVTPYADTCRVEAFAEAFSVWLIPDYAEKTGQKVRALDPETIALFEYLAGDRKTLQTLHS